MYRACLFLIALLLSAIPYGSYAQAVPDTSLNHVLSDSVAAKKSAERQGTVQIRTANPIIVEDSATAKRVPFQPNPKKAAFYSAILPGTGQLYNREYWKVPLIYAGVAASGYFIIDNSRQYQRYRKAYIDRFNPLAPNTEPLRSTAELQALRDGYKRYLDITVLLTVVGYTLQVLDAVTFAHLKNFDVSKDITLRVAPVASPNGMGLGLVVNWR